MSFYFRLSPRPRTKLRLMFLLGQGERNRFTVFCRMFPSLRGGAEGKLMFPRSIELSHSLSLSAEEVRCFVVSAGGCWLTVEYTDRDVLGLVSGWSRVGLGLVSGWSGLGLVWSPYGANFFIRQVPARSKGTATANRPQRRR